MTKIQNSKPTVGRPERNEGTRSISYFEFRISNLFRISDFGFRILRSREGFTLIELLVVVSIIGLLGSIVLASLNSARTRSRDARRIADLKQIQTALEFYFDANGRYPQPSQGWNNWSGHCTDYGNRDDYIIGLAPAYITVLPKDPRFDLGPQCYLYNANADGSEYMVLAHRTMETIVGGDPSAAGNPPYIQALDRVCCTQETIAVYSPGVRSW